MTNTKNCAAKSMMAGAFSVVILLASSASLLAGQTAPLSASPLVAQTAATPSSSPTASETTATHQPRSAAEFVDARISELHKKLQITAAQEAQFKAYADVMRSNAAAMQALFQERAQSTGPSAVDNADNRLHWYAKLTAAHAEAVSKLVPVFDTLYQSLSDQQKKIADGLFRQQLQQRRPAHKAG